jgi:hypothetical protein
MSGKKFTILFVFLVLTGLFSVGVFNLFMDPRGYLWLYTLPGINEVKPNAGGDRREKSLAITLRNYEMIVAGSSRVQVGIDPGQPVLGSGPTYNFAMSGLNMYELQKNLVYLLDQQTPQHILLGVDFLMFTDSRTVFGDFDQSLFAGKSSADILIPYLFSADTFNNSLNSLKINLRNNKFIFSDRHGHLDKTGLDVNHRQLFNTVVINNFMLNKETYAAFRYSTQRLDAIRKTIKLILDANIKVDVFINPTHARQLEVIRAMGLWPVFKKWKRDMTQIVAEVNINNANKATLWDFNYYNKISMEAVKKKNMRWFWESSHYKNATGAVMVNRILGKPSPIAGLGVFYQRFGAILTPENINSHLRAHEAGRRTYVKNFPDDVKIIQELEIKTRARRNVIKKRAAASRSNITGSTTGGASAGCTELICT